MEEVLVQSISESGISQPLTVKLDDELSATLSADSEMAIIEASSVQELNSQFAQINGESLAFAVSDSTSHDEWIQDRSSEALPADNGHTSELPIEYGHSSDSTHEPMAVKIEAKLNELLTEDGELPVLEASSVEEMSSLFKQLEEEVQAQMPQTSKHKFGQDEGETTTEVLVLETKSLEDISSAFRQLDNGHDEMKMSGDGEVNLDSEEPNLGLHVIEAKTVKTDDTSDTGSKVTKLKDLPESAESIAVDGHPIKDM
uniref:Uncharacterized protein n=1 Tax=Arundo donax TaxID=35708 RepID=A0A0A9D6S3_ARUDO